MNDYNAIEEFYRQLMDRLKDINKMEEPILREYVKLMESNSQSYMRFWMEALDEIKKLKKEIKKLRSKL